MNKKEQSTFNEMLKNFYNMSIEDFKKMYNSFDIEIFLKIRESINK